MPKSTLKNETPSDVGDQAVEAVQSPEVDLSQSLTPELTVSKVLKPPLMYFVP
jgi:hypothetical protein